MDNVVKINPYCRNVFAEVFRLFELVIGNEATDMVHYNWNEKDKTLSFIRGSHFGTWLI